MPPSAVIPPPSGGLFGRPRSPPGFMDMSTESPQPDSSRARAKARVIDSSAKIGLLDLSGGRLRQFGDDLDVFRHHEAFQTFLTFFLQIFFGERNARFQYHESFY